MKRARKRESKREKGRNPFLCSALHLFALNHAKDMALCSRAEGISIIRLEGRGGKEGKENDKTKPGYTLAICHISNVLSSEKSEKQKSERRICSITVA